jgi:CheY-like chemotaxis protein
VVKTSKLILVVEDNEAVRKAMKLLLEGDGYRVICAANGRDALDYLGRGELPFVILLDLSMPIMDGWQFCHRRRQDLVLAHIPVVLLSAEEDLGSLASTLSANGHLAKPIRIDALLSTVRQLVAEDDPRSSGRGKQTWSAERTAVPLSGSPRVSQPAALSW